MSSCRAYLGLPVSPTKIASLLYRRKDRLRPASLTLSLDGRKVFDNLGLLLDYRVACRPAVTETLANGRNLICLMQKLGGSCWETAQESLLLLYKGLGVLRCPYTIPFLGISTRQLYKLETLHRIAVRRLLGMPKYFKYISMPVEPQDP